MAEIKLTNATVTLRDAITWGQKEAINNAMLSGMKMSARSQDIDINAEAMAAGKYKAIEVCIEKIVVDGSEVSFSREWLDNLPVADGDALYAEVEKITNPEKKS